jgi:transcriptional regulator with XRE-family HTH domain
MGGVNMDADKIQKQLGLRLKELRLSKNLRQEDLEKWGFSYRYYGRIERGLVNTSLSTLLRLCKIFDVSLIELFIFMEDNVESTDQREAVIIKLSKILKENKLKIICKLNIFLDEFLTP